VASHSLFAYGTLVFEDILEMVVGRTLPSLPAHIHDHVRYRVEGEVYPALIEKPGGRVDGRLYTGLDDHAIALLDRFEGDFYDRVEILAVTDDGISHRALTYRVRDEHAHRVTQELWAPSAFGEECRKRFLDRYQGFRRI
jgi:gamma-glutamylcyclotransferase (GGCT)/AIG2-like uncharacterized protein YtfP